MKKVLSEIFTTKKMTDFLVNEVLGRFVGFIVGMSTTSWFSHYVHEKKSIKNLFGLMPRKKVLVNTTPEWLQWTLSALVGFIMLELINYFFRNKMYIPIWEFIKKLWTSLTDKKRVKSSSIEGEQQEMDF
jgi:hypothetical protein